MVVSNYPLRRCSSERRMRKRQDILVYVRLTLSRSHYAVPGPYNPLLSGVSILILTPNAPSHPLFAPGSRVFDWALNGYLDRKTDFTTSVACGSRLVCRGTEDP